MKLRVPYHKQEKLKTCGVACLRMMLAYYGDEYNESELAKNVKMYKVGTYSTDLAIAAINLDQNYKAIAYSSNLGFFSRLNIKSGALINNDILNKHAKKNKFYLNKYKEFLSNGGTLIYDFPKFELIKKQIDIKRPCLVSVNTAMLDKFWDSPWNGHYFVVVGYTNDSVIVLDPDPWDKNYEYEIPLNIFIPAWSVNAVASTDFLMIISK